MSVETFEHMHLALSFSSADRPFQLPCPGTLEAVIPSSGPLAELVPGLLGRRRGRGDIQYV